MDSTQQSEQTANDSNGYSGLWLRTAARTAVVAAIIMALLAAWYGRELLLLLFAGILVAVYVRGLSSLVTRFTKMPAYGATWLVMAVMLLLVGGLGAWLAPHLSEQIPNLSNDVVTSFEELRSHVSERPWAERLYDSLQQRADSLWNSLNLVGMSQSLFSTVLGSIAALVLVVFVSIYLSLNPQIYVSHVISFIPPRGRERAREIVDTTVHTLRWWCIGKSVSIAVVGLLTWIGLSLLGVKLALSLAVIAGLLSFIPNFGPIMSVVPAVLVGLSQRPILALWVLVLYIVIQVVESYIITPLVQRQAVSLLPVFLILGQVALGIISGVLGLALATPVVVVLQVLAYELYLRDTLGAEAAETKA
jgi:predicted PurR-regulated permease PerM